MVMQSDKSRLFFAPNFSRDFYRIKKGMVIDLCSKHTIDFALLVYEENFIPSSFYKIDSIKEVRYNNTYNGKYILSLKFPQGFSDISFYETEEELLQDLEAIKYIHKEIKE